MIVFTDIVLVLKLQKINKTENYIFTDPESRHSKSRFLRGQNFSFENFAQEKVQKSHIKSHNMCES